MRIAHPFKGEVQGRESQESRKGRLNLGAENAVVIANWRMSSGGIQPSLRDFRIRECESANWRTILKSPSRRSAFGGPHTGALLIPGRCRHQLVTPVRLKPPNNKKVSMIAKKFVRHTLHNAAARLKNGKNPAVRCQRGQGSKKVKNRAFGGNAEQKVDGTMPTRPAAPKTFLNRPVRAERDRPA